MARIVRVKNTKGVDDVWVGQSITYLAYHDLEESEFQDWGEDSKVISDVGAGFLTVNKGADGTDDFLVPAKGLAWLQGNTQPPRSKDGDWHVVNENFAHVSGNKGINWVIEKELENEETYSEFFVLPPGRHATINLLKGGSEQVASSITLEWFEEIAVDEYMRINPWVRGDEIIATKVNGAHTSGDTVITVHNTNGEVDLIRRYHYYCFYDTVAETGFHAKVIDKDSGASTITLEAGLPTDFPDNMPLGLTDRVIGRVGNQISTDSLMWVSPPNDFIGNGKNHFRITIVNEDKINVGTIMAVVNGWHTATSGGD